MNKSQIIDSVAKESNLKRKDAEAAISAFLSCIQTALSDGDKVQLVGFGTFEVKERSERIGRNPHTQEMMTIPASRHPAFTAGKTLKEIINKK